LRILAGATASLINGSVLRNAIGIDVDGAASVRNTLVTANAIGLSAGSSGMIATTYSDVIENTTADRRGSDVGLGDLAMTVEFVAANDWRLADGQGTTDRGDPADPFDEEPQPNGGRINLGAFGNTPFAELSAPPSAGVSPDPAGAPVPVTAPPPPVPDASVPDTQGKPVADVHGGGGCTLAPGRSFDFLTGGLTLMALAISAARRRRHR